MRKLMSKDVTFTTYKVAKMKLINDELTITNLPEEKIMGTISEDKAHKLMVKKHKTQVSVHSFTTNTITYEMDVVEFIKHASIKKDESTQEKVVPVVETTQTTQNTYTQPTINKYVTKLT